MFPSISLNLLEKGFHDGKKSCFQQRFWSHLHTKWVLLLFRCLVFHLLNYLSFYFLQYDDSCDAYVDAKQYYFASFSARNSMLNNSLQSEFEFLFNDAILPCIRALSTPKGQTIEGGIVF